MPTIATYQQLVNAVAVKVGFPDPITVIDYVPSMFDFDTQPNMAGGYEDNRAEIRIENDPQAQLKLTDEETEGVIAHEIGHLSDPRLKAHSEDRAGEEQLADRFAAQHGFGPALIAANIKAAKVVPELIKGNADYGTMAQRNARIQRAISK